MLEKIEETESFIFENFPPAELYIDDLEEFFRLIQSSSNRVELEVGNLRLNDPADFSALSKNFGGGRLGSVRIKAKDIWFDFKLNSNGAQAYIASPTPLTLGIIEKIRLIMERRKRSRWWHVRKLSYVVSIVFVLLCFWPTHQPHHLKEWSFDWGFLVLSLLVWLWAGSFCKKNKVLIWATQKHLKKSFFERNGDQLLVNMMSALVGAVVGAIITVVITK